jgi:ribonuclease Z
MPTLVFLGTASAVPDENHENTYMAILGREQTILIDCANNTFVRLEQAGIRFQDVTDVILTHFHPDHVSGLPSLLLDMWLMGRKDPLTIYGLEYTVERMEKLMDAYDWASWPGFFPVTFRTLPAEELSPVLESKEFRVIASPVHHLIPNIGLRVDFLESGKSLAYSCDTEPCQEVVRLADGVDILVHECGGASLGHTPADKAGEIASRSEAASLYLIHYRTRGVDVPKLVTEAQTTYSGPVTIAEDFMKLEL